MENSWRFQIEIFLLLFAKNLFSCVIVVLTMTIRATTTASDNHSITPSNHHTYNHIITPSYNHNITPSQNHIIKLPSRRTTTSSHHHTFKRSHIHTITLSHHQNVTASNNLSSNFGEMHHRPSLYPGRSSGNNLPRPPGDIGDNPAISYHYQLETQMVIWDTYLFHIINRSSFQTMTTFRVRNLNVKLCAMYSEIPTAQV